MFGNYLKIALRNIRKHKGYSLINVVGLASGICCSILVFLFVTYEFSYDKYHEKADRTYRLAITGSTGGSEINQTSSSALTFQTLFAEFPEIEIGVKIGNLGTQSVIKGAKTFYESRIFAVDSTVFDVFTAPLIHGTPDQALSEPNTVVLTEETAIRYFGRIDVLGEMISIKSDDILPLKITGVSQNVPDNSHFRFDLLVSLTSFPEAVNSTGWSDNHFVSYFVMHEGTTENQVLAIGKKLENLNQKYNPREGYEAWLAKGNYWEYYLQPLTSIHLNSNITGEFEANGNLAHVYVFLIIGIIVLLIACINFVNLSTAKASLRAGEVGIRKVVGSGRKQLIVQFMGESILISLIALSLGLVIVELLLPQFRSLVGRPIEMHYFDNVIVIPALLLLGITVGVISGSYPAFVLSSLKPVSILKTHTPVKSTGIWIRNALIIFQFTISIFLIISTVTINQQLTFIQDKEIGFDKEQVLVIDNPRTLTGNLQAFKETLRSHGDIINASGSTTLPGKRFRNIGFRIEGDRNLTLNLAVCDYEFLETLSLEMASGRFFSPEFGSDKKSIVINETTCRLLGWDEPIGKTVIEGRFGENMTVIGVVKDMHFESIHQNVRPMALLLSGGLYDWSERNISVRINTDNIPGTIGFIESAWNQFVPNMPLTYSFLSEDYDKMYFSEKRTRQLSTVLCGLAIFISCIGLFGLASFVADQRSREIGIRRVLGASVSGIVRQLNSSFVKWVVLSNIIAWPIAWYAMNNWLSNFAYRISLDIRVFFAAGFVAIIIALMTVSCQSIRAALANPVESLKKE